MCYTGGPRCSGHVGNELAAARGNLAVLERESTKDDEKVYEAFTKKERLEMEFNSTPEGQRLLAAEVEALRKEGQESEADTTEIKMMLAADLRKADMEARAKRLADGERLSRACERPEVKSKESSTESRKIAEMERKAAEARGEKVETKNEARVRKADASTLMSVSPSTASYSDYDSSLIPQANKVTKIASVVESIEAGANTSSYIGKSLEMDGRQGHYYANAAVYLGLVEKVDSGYEGGGHEYRLTPNGELFKNEDSFNRGLIMRDMVNAAPLMKTYHESGRDVDTLKEEIIRTDPNISDDTVTRRAATVTSWDRTVNSKSFGYKLNEELAASKGRAKLAAFELGEERKAKKLANAKANESRGGFCEKHGTMRSPAGICFDCQDD